MWGTILHRPNGVRYSKTCRSPTNIFPAPIIKGPRRQKIVHRLQEPEMWNFSSPHPLLLAISEGGGGMAMSIWNLAMGLRSRSKYLSKYWTCPLLLWISVPLGSHFGFMQIRWTEHQFIPFILLSNLPFPNTRLSICICPVSSFERFRTLKLWPNSDPGLSWRPWWVMPNFYEMLNGAWALSLLSWFKTTMIPNNDQQQNLHVTIGLPLCR